MRRALILAAFALAPLLPASAQHAHGATGPRPAPGARDDSPPRRAPEPPAERRVEIRVTAGGFEPALVAAKKGERIRLVVTRVAEGAPAKEFVLDEALFVAKLPLNRAVSVSFAPGRAGEFPFTDGSGAVRGVLRVEE